eukprot:NODE_95_length_21511_cov_0.501168.p6 type:complete len:363 gc:universal NODE_95_length_21511_cov_0.501168:17882-18970(+)
MAEFSDPLKVLLPVSPFACKMCNIKLVNEEFTFLTCIKCNSVVHPECCSIFPKDYLEKGILLGDRYFQYTCIMCHPDGEILKRPTVMWLAYVELVLYHLFRTSPGIQDGSTFWKMNMKLLPIRYYDAKDEIFPLIEEYWEFLMPKKDRPKQLLNKFNSTLNSNSIKVFLRMHDKSNSWSLRNPVLPNSDPRVMNRVKANSKEFAHKFQILQNECVPEVMFRLFSTVCPIVDLRHEEILYIQLKNQSNTMPLSTKDRRLMAKLRLRKLKRDNNCSLYDLDNEIASYLLQRVNAPLEVQIIKHNGLPHTDNGHSAEMTSDRVVNAFNPEKRPRIHVVPLSQVDQDGFVSFLNFHYKTKIDSNYS